VGRQMGHPKPFRVDYVAIGNEDCGHPNYEQNYLLFYNALTKSYPQLKLVANCELGGSTPVQFWDYHLYPTPDQFLTEEYQHQFDSTNRKITPLIFNSEYASHDNFESNSGTGIVGYGNLYAAIGEAVWLTQLQRNSDLVKIASYAPLLENMNSAQWHPNMIRLVQGNGAHSVYGTPSYWNQWMYARAHIDVDPTTHQMLAYTLPPISNRMTVAVAPSRGISQSTKAEILILKLINYGDQPVNLQLSLVGVDSNTSYSGNLWSMSAANGNRSAENSLKYPTAISPVVSAVTIATKMTAQMGPYSIMFIQATKSSRSQRKVTGSS
jgi:alpha-N-arabinofuranosidase